MLHVTQAFRVLTMKLLKNRGVIAHLADVVYIVNS